MNPKFNANESEPRIYAKWEEFGAFQAGANAKPGNGSFCIVIPPPNVTGALHMGHAFNNTIQDILIRWQRLRGMDVLWQPGQDHAGIATQMVVERQLEQTGSPSRHELGREEFLKKVWDWKEQSGGAIINQLKRLGASCDWSRDRFTMDKGFHNAVLQVFIELYRKGCIYRGKRLVNWDPHFETAISDIEVEQVEVNGTMWRLRYPLENGETYNHPVRSNDNGDPVEFQSRDYLVVATTRPETMLGDSGIAVNPDDKRYQHLIGKTVKLPLAQRSIPIVSDSYANPDKGTGAVKITPAHDFNDWDVGQRCGLPAINVMSHKAEMYLSNNDDFLFDCKPDPEALALDGLDRYEARRKIIKLASDQGWLDGEDNDIHTVPHGDRSKVAVEPYLTNQWFVDTSKIVDPAIDAVKSGRTKIYPAQYENMYIDWLEKIEPWCISRQLWWGHQIPIWYDKDGNQYCAASEAEARKLAGDKVIWRDEDVLDTWFSSGLWPIGTLGWPQSTPELARYFPTDVLVTGFDIIFFWVARMMMMQLAVVNDIPFHTIYVHALVRDEQGKKMSKSLGNVIDPIELIEKYGADALRFTLASMAVMGRDLRLSESRVAGYRNFVTKIWNAARFAEINECEPQSDYDPSANENSVNRWIVGMTSNCGKMVNDALEGYRFNDAANHLYEFIWGNVCDWYLEFAKTLLTSNNQDLYNETRATLAWIIQKSLIFLHPFMPFVTEELWQYFGDTDRMLVHADWPYLDQDRYICQKAKNDIQWTIGLIEEIRSVRSQLNVPAGSKIMMLELNLEPNEQRVLVENQELVMRLARISTIQTANQTPMNSASIAVPGGVFCLPLAGVINVAAEIERLNSTLSGLANNRVTLEKRLSDTGFLSKAPAHVISETRDRLVTIETEIEVLTKAINRIEKN